MNRKYKHIFFDLDNTLWDFEKNSFFAMQITFNHFLKNKSPLFEQFFEVYLKFNHSLWQEYRNNTISKKELICKRFQMTFDELKVTGIDPEEMNRFYLNEMPKQKYLEKGVPETLDYLKQKNYILHIITNGFREVQYKKLENTGLKKYFTKVFISEEIKVPKPGRKIFEYAIKSANAKKTESVMIGDDWEVDICGAIGFGIDAIYYNKSVSNGQEINRNLTKRKRDVVSVGEIQKLIDLL